MSDIINLLPDSIANQIAAGEVIQRPSSVIKELIENAIDAGATDIKVIIKIAGKVLIQVVDNGIGMTHTDARMSFERHATSKISKSADLFELHTLGFRGEALASIAAIAHVELKTQQYDSDTGTILKIEGSKVSSHEVGKYPFGTSISVKNLFYNVPARRKFLKSDPVELKHIMDEFTRLAIIHHEVFFNLFHNDNELYHLPISNLRLRLMNIFGKQSNEKLVPVLEETDFLTINGFVGKPDYAKKTRGDQFLFANGRFIKSNYINHAIRSSYENLIQKDHHPFFVLMLTAPPDSIDINIHPTKQEVKFENERLIYNYLKVSVKHALGKYSIAPVIDFDADDDYSFQRMQQQSKIPPAAPYPSDINSHKGVATPYYPKQEGSKKEWINIYEGLQPTRSESTSKSTKQSELKLDASFTQQNNYEPSCFRTSKGYIINPIKSGFVIIDQRYAHERIVFERCLQKMTTGRSSSQKTLFPETIELTAAQSVVLNNVKDKLHRIGVDIENFGARTFIIQGMPAGINVNGKQLIENIIDDYTNDWSSELKLEEKLAAVFAKQTAIKKTKQLSKEEMILLIDDLFACKMPYTSPSGHKCFVTVNENEISKYFS
ncbi:MAG: DNA mismatch repair endonuclease MutL [Saprospiraceae bacterium]